MAKPAVFLDRDGVLNIEAGYIRDVHDLNLIPGSAAAVRSLNDRGIFCCLVSNQSGPARGYYGIDHVEKLHDRLCKLLKKEADAYLDALFYCPYLSHSAGGTNPNFTKWGTWRKPNTGMLVAAAWEHDLDLSQSFMVGDKATDVDLAHNAGLKGILVQTGYGKEVLGGAYQHQTKPDYVAENLQDGAIWILENLD
ncbi:D-alpha,beta-D-heptose 1,7-bisphosphate phosphatase [[Leptolyngbya] sp. PCC 7376]|uniref:D-glycero-alpha-D-manno-heptose-1,7-bisphosphate 7-phosphatase n=1 Tax=[Leptolyngbya] sp. PCC 7376 TaxID=111781 RepID=UPI00029F010C|nr:HAD family hydrolase [[Leptolyngbya] sp. PCC 7376]AFY39710.1 D-alpha,beta-D-heptose 1,7-bisphosphate phosphatase [[Leptolyngbya] sp. PCC 7376]